MTEPPQLPGRRYGEKEVSRLLRRATELQREDPTFSDESGEGGWSLAELEEIGREAGIDPRYLRRAARELERQPGGSVWTRIIGDSPSLRVEDEVEGELDQAGFEAVAQAIQTAASEHGQPSLLGRTLTWQAETASKTRSMQVVVACRDGSTHILVEERLHQLASGIFGGGMGGFGAGIGFGLGVPLGLGTLGSPLLAVLFPVGAIALSFMGAREVFRAVAAGRRRAVDRLAAELRAAVERHAGRQALDEGEEPPLLSRG